MNLSNLRRKHVKNTNWPKEKKLQAVVNYLATGNMKLVSGLTGVEYGLLRQWKMQPWWKEFEIEIRATENLELDNKLTKLVDKSLDATLERLENGDFIYDQKTGEIRRKPVNMKDAAKVSVDLLTKRELLRGNATNRTESVQISMADQLQALANEFAKMTGKQVVDVDVIDVTVKEPNGSITDEADETASEPWSEERSGDGSGASTEAGPDEGWDADSEGSGTTGPGE